MSESEDFASRQRAGDAVSRQPTALFAAMLPLDAAARTAAIRPPLPAS